MTSYRASKASEDGPFAGDEQGFGFDAYQRLESHSIGRGASGGSFSQSYGYDALERVQTLTSSGPGGAGLFTYNYKGDTSILSRLDLPNNTKVEQEYDALQRLSEVKNLSNAGANLASYAYAYDTRDVRTGVVSQMAGDPLKQIAYSYDAVNQLTGEVATGGAANSAYSNAFTYDSMGNRTQLEHLKSANTTLTTGTSNRLNQLSALSRSSNGVTSTTALLHDVSGNLTQQTASDGSKTLYTYDDADRLWRIERKNAAGEFTSKSEWVYDYASRKAIRREFSFAAGAWALQSETRRVFDGLDVIQERNGANEVTAQLTRDGNIGGILARSTATGVSYFGYDGGGNVTLLTDEAGAEVGRYSYDAFGNTLEASGARAGENPYRFSTKEFHTASGLYDFGYRFYSPGTGRWINRDPIAESGGTNLYAMVGNSPTNLVDPDGRNPIAIILIAIGALLYDQKGANLVDGTAHVFFTPFDDTQLNDKAMIARVPSHAIRATNYFKNIYQRVEVHPNATGKEFLSALRDKDTKAIWVMGHGSPAPGKKILFSGAVDAKQIRRALRGRTLDEAYLFVCNVGDDEMKSSLVGKSGKFWGTEMFNTGFGNFPTWTDPNHFGRK